MKKWVGALLISTKGELILQERDINPRIINSGKTTLFGGSVDKDENEEECLKREMKEELGLIIENYTFFGKYEKRLHTHGEDCDCYVYLVNNISATDLKVNEGRGFLLVSRGDDYSSSKFSQITQKVLNDYFSN